MKNDSLSLHFEIREGIQGMGVFATHAFPAGSFLFKMQGQILTYPTRTSVQIDEKKHIEDAIAGSVNHACTPNSRVDRPTRSFIALTDIKQGDEITFDYRENEDVLACPFICKCCNKKIKGKKLLPS